MILALWEVHSVCDFFYKLFLEMKPYHKIAWVALLLCFNHWSKGLETIQIIKRKSSLEALLLPGKWIGSPRIRKDKKKHICCHHP